jgi:MerR family copper efflux transcriptional regulator
MSHLLRIGELAAAANVSPRTVDYYTQLGLLHPAERTDGGFRLYHPAAAETITAIKRLESHGINLDDITAAMNGATTTDTNSTLTRLAADLATLQDAATATPDPHALLGLISVRAHALIEMALEIINSPLV